MSEIYDLIPKQFKPMPATRRFAYELLLGRRPGSYVGATTVGWMAKEAGIFSGKTSESAWGFRHLSKLVKLGLVYQLWSRSYSLLDDSWMPEHRDNLRPHWWPEERVMFPKWVQEIMWERERRGLA